MAPGGRATDNAAMNSSSRPLRQPGRLDQWLGRVQSRLEEATQGTAPDTDLNRQERRHASGLMRVNHAGEVAAQGLYLGQAAFARNPANRAHLLQAAAEEREHLDLCFQRLDELGSAPSLLDPLWHAGSFALGATVAHLGDPVSLGFVSETERQVEQHLDGHLEQLPAQDRRSRAIVEKMKADEIAHGAAARARGGIELPRPVRGLMRMTAKLMTGSAYWI